MFDIRGNTIYFRGVPFAEIGDKAWPTLRTEACDQIEGAAEWSDLYDEHEEEINKAYKDGYDEAHVMMQGQIDQREDRIEVLEATIYDLKQELQIAEAELR